MGLAERRRIAAIKDQHAPRFQQELNEAIGFALPFEIDVSSFPENGTVLDCYDYYFESYGPGLVVTVFKGICQDEMGKQAVKDKIKKIVFKNSAASPDDPGDKEVKIEGGTLLVRESFYGYSDKLFGESDLRTAIENML
ncbi:MAG: hypothetical protein IT384_15490 [Deltaproteobacteria bacterium]|nr:hypothetical protein [Deltaproteobacteria bacterium]